MKESEKPSVDLPCRKIIAYLYGFPLFLLPLAFIYILTACGHHQMEKSQLEGMAISKGLDFAGERAAADGKKSLLVDLNQFSRRKVRKVCLQSYSEYSSLSRLAQSEQFEQDVKENIKSIRDWPSPPSAESDYRFVVFFDHGGPTWFSYGSPSDNSQRDKDGFIVKCFRSSHLRLVEEEGGFVGKTYKYWRVHWTGMSLLK